MKLLIKKQICKCVALVVGTMLILTTGFCKAEIITYAYTQEEIDAAKAWLSANGYSPDRAGAEAAYQDYLNGKFGTVGGAEAVQPAESVTPEPIPESVSESIPESVPEPIPESIPESAPESVVEPISEPTSEVVSESNVEAVTEEATVVQDTEAVSEEVVEETISEVISEEETVEPVTESVSDVEETIAIDESLETESVQEAEEEVLKLTVSDWMLIGGVSLMAVALAVILVRRFKS